MGINGTKLGGETKNRFFAEVTCIFIRQLDILNSSLGKVPFMTLLEGCFWFSLSGSD